MIYSVLQKGRRSKYIRETDPCPEQSRISHCYITAQHRLEAAKTNPPTGSDSCESNQVGGTAMEETGHGASRMKGIVGNQQPGNRAVPVPWFARGSSHTSPG